MAGLINTLLAMLSSLLAPVPEEPKVPEVTKVEELTVVVRPWNQMIQTSELTFGYSGPSEVWPDGSGFDKRSLAQTQSFSKNVNGTDAEKDDPTLCCPYQ